MTLFNWIVSSVINKFPTTSSQFNFFYFLHKTIFLPYNWLITFNCRHFTDTKTLLTQNLLTMQNPEAKHRSWTVHSWYSDLSLRLCGPWSLNVLTISFVFLWVRGPAHYENTQCYFSVGLPRTLCAFESLTLDNILKPNTFLETPSPNFIQTASYCWFKKFRIKWYHWITSILEARRILRVGFTFQPVSFGQWNVVG